MRTNESGCDVFFNEYLPTQLKFQNQFFAHLTIKIKLSELLKTNIIQEREFTNPITKVIFLLPYLSSNIPPGHENNNFPVSRNNPRRAHSPRLAVGTFPGCVR